jgi:2-dehydropantoate 2-reductase
VILLAMKSQDTSAALVSLAATGVSTETPVVCVQNGVENERTVLRWFRHVYGVCVMCPATYLDPGVVQASSAPVTGILDVGRYPEGTDATASAIAHAFASSTFSAQVQSDIMRWKYAKLLLNLSNAVEAVCGPSARGGEIDQMACREGEACLRRAGIDFVSQQQDAERRDGIVRMLPIGGRRRRGGSSWQSLQRMTGTIETPYLNGEIVLLGRLHGVHTPVNDLITRLALDAARARRPPGSVTSEAFLEQLDELDGDENRRTESRLDTGPPSV